MSEENKDLVNRIYNEAISHGVYDVINEQVASGCVVHGLPMGINNQEEFKTGIEVFRSAFPDLHMLIEQQIAEYDRVCDQGYITGTQRGEFLGVPASGNQIKVNLNAIWHMNDGLLIESWVQLDMVGLMRQIKSAPAFS